MGKVGLSNNTMALLLYADSKNGSGMQGTQGVASWIFQAWWAQCAVSCIKWWLGNIKKTKPHNPETWKIAEPENRTTAMDEENPEPLGMK